MSEHETAQAAATSSFWQGLGILAGAAGTFLGKHLWDKRKPTRQASHADFVELRQLLEELRSGQEERGRQMAVIEVTMATKEDLALSVEKMADKARVMVDAVHNRVSEHLRDHSKAA